MNLYLRYFDRETLVTNVSEAIDFLRSLGEIDVTPELEADIRDYAAGDMQFPKRYKVRQRVYFIVIKTTAATMQDFKDKKALRSSVSMQNESKQASQALFATRLNEDKPGWYEGVLDFKRVVLSPSTGKFEYCDTHFVARCKAKSPMDCYNRIVEHLRERVDSRSQFPSAKGKNFQYRYIGMWK